MDKGELPLGPQRQQAGEGGIQPKSAVERQCSQIRSRGPDRDRRADLVIRLLGIGHDNIEPIDGAAQKNHDQPLGAALRSRRPGSRAEWQQGHAGRQSKKIAPVHCRTHSRTALLHQRISSVVSAAILIH